MTSEIHKKIYPVLLAGGTGTRLWPVSREQDPKQLAKLFGEFSLLQVTVQRLLPMVEADRIRIVCGTAHQNEIERHMNEMHVDPADKILAEPCGRNTAPAILLAVLQILPMDPEAIMAVFPADHMIGDVSEFHSKIKTAARLAENGYIVTYGIQPDYPETGYGYIEGDAPLTDGAMTIKRFVEKPDDIRAKQYVEAGNFFWNSGMFTFKASAMKAEFKRHQPDMLAAMQNLNLTDPEAMEAGYRALPNISIDYAIMERTRKGAVLPSSFGWSDIGSWKSLYDFLSKDENGNVLKGDVIAKNSQGSFIMGQHRLVAANHLKDTVVVETPDAIFISDMENSREVKSIVTHLKEADRFEHKQHKTVYHSWGRVSLLEENNVHQVSAWHIFPDACLKLDINPAATAHISVTRGKAILTLNNQTEDLSQGEVATIPANQEASIKNSSTMPLDFVQVAIY